MINRTLSILAAALLATPLMLGACTTVPAPTAEDPNATKKVVDVQKANNILRAVSIGVSVGKSSFTILYGSLPPCSDTKTPPLCKSPGVLAEVDKAVSSVNDAIALARKTISTLSSTQEDIDKAVDIVLQASEALAAVLARYGITISTSD